MHMKWHQRLTRRERQVMDIVLAAGEASAAEIHQRLPEPPSYSAVRALLRVMEEKGHLVHVSEGPRYVYKPAISPKKARASVLQQLLDTLFEGSREELVAALLDSGDLKADKQELDRLAKLIEEARQQGR